jgi:glycosyltransferase involved in cell wall biosynthesis
MSESHVHARQDVLRPDAVTPAEAKTAPSAPQKLRRRVLYVDHTASLGGGEIALLNLVRHLNRNCYIPVVVLFSDGPLRQQLIDAGAEVHLLPLSPDVVNTRKDSLGGKTLLQARNVWTTFLFSLQLRRLIQEWKIDLVHTNSLKADIIGGVAAKLARKPLLWHVRDRIEDDYLPPLVVRVFRRLARVLPDLVVANSGATLRTLQWLNPQARAVVVHDGTLERPDLPPIAPNPAPVLGLVGRISPWKGQHIFIRAASLVRERFPGARFQIIGAALFNEAEYEKFIRDQVASLGLGDFIEFTGFRKDVPDLIAKMDVLVHASVVGEPFGQVVIEGMAAGKPVVATNGGGVPEIVRDGETGYLVPMGDADAMADAMIRLLENPDMAADMGEKGRRRVHEHFTIQATAQRVERLYDEVLMRKSRRID